MSRANAAAHKIAAETDLASAESLGQQAANTDGARYVELAIVDALTGIGHALLAVAETQHAGHLNRGKPGDR